MFGPVTYDRGSEVDREFIKSLDLDFPVFQKDASFADDHDCRLALQYVGEASCMEEHLHFEIGRCDDIMTISDMPR
jgi:hypothetical protein